MRVLTRTNSGVDKLADLKGKIVAVGDLAGPDKNFFSVSLRSRVSIPTRKSIGGPIPAISSISRSRRVKFRRSWRRTLWPISG